ncbi:MAG TPA: hypothetical protein VFI58_12250 [Xanthobacteraceae bacterium]|jgi:uncharacterized protein YlzI (FlbEa/FlbD family)|nr:hypothetical protein [Xanthobacteraceae bacterium]
MPAKAAVVLAVPLVFAAAVAFADTPNRTGDRSPFVAEAVAQSSVDRIAAVRNAVNGNESLAPSQLALFKSAFICRGGLDLTTVWIKLTDPAGNAIHVNLEHITSVRSTTQVPGARAQLDLASGKFQGVQEDIEEVMRLISAASGARERDDDT